VTLVERRRISRSQLTRPSGPDLLKADLRYAYHQISLMVCEDCRAQVENSRRDEDHRLRSSTQVLLILAAALTALVFAIEWVRPTAGPSLLTSIWQNPYAAPKPYAFQPKPAATPYRPPF
jgi:hypothetical protein